MDADRIQDELIALNKAVGHMASREDIEKVHSRISDLRDAVTKSSTDLARLESTLGAHVGHTRDSINVLFDKAGDHDKRLGSIEKNYVTESMCDKRHGEHACRLSACEKLLTGVRLRIAAWIGGAAAVSAIVTLSIQYLTKKL